MVENWESLYREQEALSKLHKQTDHIKLQSTLSDRANELVQREQGMAENASRLAAAMAAFSTPSDGERERMLRLREEAVTKREVALAAQEEEASKRNMSA